MAKMIFTLEEVKDILLSNNRIPHYITDLRTEGAVVSLKIETGFPIKKSISPIVEYISFDYGVVTLKMTVKYLKGKRLEKVANWLIHKFQKEMPAFIKLDYPNIYVDVEMLLTDNNFNWVKVESVVFESDSFVVTTCSA